MYTTDRITLQNKEMDRYTSKQATWKTFGHGHSHSQRHIQTHTQPHSHGHLHIQLSHVRKPTGSGVEWAECSLMMGRAVEFKFLILDNSVCQWAFSLLVIWCLRPWVQILHSAVENNLSPFDLNIACLCQSIEIINNTNT